MRQEFDWRTRNNPIHIDLFERSSQSLSSSGSSSTLDMALNNEGNVRRRLSDYVRPVLQRPVTRIHASLARNANFRIDSHVMSMLPIFHGKPSEDPYRHVNELSQVCEINHIHNVSADVMKMKLFPATLRDRAKDWFLKLGKEFTSWTKMEEEFLRKYYSVGKITSIRKDHMSLPKDRVKHFTKLERDLETSLESALTIECLTMSLHKYFMMG